MAKTLRQDPRTELERTPLTKTERQMLVEALQNHENRVYAETSFYTGTGGRSEPRVYGLRRRDMGLRLVARGYLSLEREHQGQEALYSQRKGNYGAYHTHSYAFALTDAGRHHAERIVRRQ